MLDGELQWLQDVEPGHAVVARGRAPLYPQSVWTRGIDDEDTWVITVPTLSEGDHCVVLDVLVHEDNRTFAALMATPVGIGCAILLAEHFQKV